MNSLQLSNQSLVPPEGSPLSEITLIGEAPGEKELLHKRPFIGTAGQRLDSLLVSVPLLRKNLYITNVFKHNPGPISNHFKVNKQTKEITTSPELELAAAELREELQKTSSKIFIPLGGIALYALTGKYPITSWRGSILDTPNLGRVIPTYHPSFLLRNPKEENVFIHDLKRAVREKELLPLPKRTLHLAPSFSEMYKYLTDIIKNHQTVGFDIETSQNPKSGWELTCFAFAKTPFDAMCFPLTKSGYQQYMSIEEEWEILQLLRTILEDKNKIIVGQNLTFDLFFIPYRYKIAINCQVEDTMVASAIHSPDSKKDLGFLTSIYTREPYYKEDGKQHMLYGGPDLAFWRYNALDAAIVLEILQAIKKNLELKGNLGTYEIQRNIIKPLLFMSLRGLIYDKKNSLEEAARIHEVLKGIKQDLQNKCGIKFNPSSSKQVMNYFYGERGLVPYLKKGRPTADDGALQRIFRKGFPEAQQILDFRVLSKYRSTYLNVLLDPDLRLRTAYKPVGTKTGRTSSTKTIFSTGGNIQNPPRMGRAKFRQYIQADPGYIMYETDLSRAENVLVDFLCDNEPAIEAFYKGLDSYAFVASQMSGLSYEEVLRQHKEKIPAPIGDGKSTWRQLGKTCKLALNYGMGYDKLSLENFLPLKDAKELFHAYFHANPAILRYQMECTKLGPTLGLRNPLGRYRIFHRFSRPMEMMNFIPQSTVADITHTTLHLVYENLPEVILLNEIHDALLYEIPISLGPEKHLELLIKLTNFYKVPLQLNHRTLIIESETKGGLNWGEMKEISLTLDSIKGLFNEKVGRLA